MGCIGRIISIIVIIFAVIGFKSIGGISYIQDFINNYNSSNEEKTFIAASKTLDTSKMSSNYIINSAKNIAGFKLIEIEYQKAPQKIYIIDSKGLIKLSKEDFYSNQIQDILEHLLNKFAYQAIRLENLKIIRSGSFVALGNQKIPYIIFEADVVRGTVPKMYGMLGVAENPTGKNDIILSFVTLGKYNQTVSEEFFHQVNYKKISGAKNGI